jgi:hypothetical protein
MVPSRSEQAVGHGAFVQLLRAEFTNFRRVRSWMISLCGVVVVVVILSFIVALASHARNPTVPTGPDGEAVTDTYMFVHQPLAGDGTITARITSLSGVYTSTNASRPALGTSSDGQPGSQLQPGLAPWAKAGIILEPNTNQGTDAYTIVNGYFPISPWVGLAVLAIYTLVALGAAMWLLRDRRAP